MSMRSAALLAAFSAATAPAAQAGGFAPVVVTPPPQVVIEPPAPRSSFGLILPLVLLGGLIALAVASSDDDDDDEGDGDDDPIAASDARLKTDIVRTGISPSGLPVYEFQYLWGDTTYQGVMAQDLLSLQPDAVVHGPFGALLVDYGMIDVDFHAVD